jgi:transcriptional regulator with XRE-family HTH domain
LGGQATTELHDDAQWLRELLKSSGLSQRQAAALLGVSRSTLALIATGRRKLTGELRTKLESELTVGVVTGELITKCDGYSENCT